MLGYEISMMINLSCELGADCGGAHGAEDLAMAIMGTDTYFSMNALKKNRYLSPFYRTWPFCSVFWPPVTAVAVL
jgi:hypothetical protein